MIKSLLNTKVLPKWFAIFICLIGFTSGAQNAIVGSGFSTGWGGGCPNTGGGNFSYFSEVYGGTWGTTRTPNGTGDQYWRFGIDWSGTTAHRTITVGSDVTVAPNTTYTLSSTCTTNGALRYNVSSTSYRYVFKTLNAGTNPTGQFVFFEVQGTVRSVSSVSSSPAAIAANSNVTVTAELNGAFAAGQAAYIRYSTDNFASTKVVPMTGSGTTYTGTIPATDNAGGSTVRYYIFTSGTANVAANGSNANLYTINFNNNGGSNYSYYVYGTPATPGPMSGSASVCENTAQTYSVPSDPNIVSYNWTLPQGWTGSSTTNSINVTTGSTGGNISVSGTNPNGTSLSLIKVTTITQTLLIQSESLDGQTACAGGSLSALSITTAGASSYQWYRNTTASNSGGTPIPGATSSSYTPSTGMIGTAYYYCVASGSCGATASVTSSVSGAIVVNGLANDSASNAGYSSGFSGGTNGGAGFGPWIVNTSGSVSGVFKGTSADIGTSWGLYANSGSGVAAHRSLNQPMTIGQTLSFSLDNGFVDNGKQIGFKIIDGSEALMTSFYFVGGSSNYAVLDNLNAVNTNVAYTTAGLSVTFAYTAAETFSLSITKSGVTTVMQNLHFAAGSGQPTYIQIYNLDAGNGGNYDCFFNNLRVGYPSIFVQPSISNQTAVCQNGIATPLSVTAYGDSLAYQWYHNSTASNSGGNPVSGAQSSTFAPPTDTVGTSYYYCVVSYSGSGSCVSPPLASSVSGAITVIAPTTFYADADGDQYGNLAVTTLACGSPPEGYAANGIDCNDDDDAVFQSATLYIDNDGDFFDNGTQLMCYGEDEPAGYSEDTLGPDCDDNLTLYADMDQDGFGSNVKVACASAFTSTNSDDCNDNQTRYADNDGDTYGSLVKVACGGSANNTDCNDANNQAYPGHAEIGYNLIDDDCDGFIDEGFPPKITTIMSAQCDQILPAIDTQIYANLVAGAQGYQWRITTTSGPSIGQVQLLNTALRVMRLTQLGTYAYNTTYKVEVAVYFAGFLQPYTSSLCTVSTPAITTSLANCAQTLTTMGDVIYANNVPHATGYRFLVDDGVNFTTIDRPVREFRMNLITAFQVKYNKTYNVRVMVKNTNGIYLPQGSLCTVNTPLFPTTSIQDSQCDGYAPASMGTIIYAYSYPAAIAYGFNLSGNNLGAEGVEIIKTTRSFKLSDFTGLVQSATYNVKVRLIFNYTDPAGPYGKTCTVTVPASLRMASLPFNVKAYPNPFADNFNIDVTTSNKENIAVKVYDMVGRLLESRDVDVAEMESLQVGDKFPSGVYNVIVSQGEEVKTLRVIKR